MRGRASGCDDVAVRQPRARPWSMRNVEMTEQSYAKSLASLSVHGTHATGYRIPDASSN